MLKETIKKKMRDSTLTKLKVRYWKYDLRDKKAMLNINFLNKDRNKTCFFLNKKIPFEKKIN